MGRFPIDVTTILVALHVVVAIFTCLFVAAGGGAVLNFMLFDSARVLGAGQIWRLATYAFVHSPSMLLWFAIEMYMLFVFGREVERFIGQRAYIALYALLLFIPSLLLTVWGLGQRTGLAGSLALHFGVFVAFATSIAVGFCFVRFRGVGPELVWWENLKTRLQPKPKFKVVPKPTPARRDDDDLSESVDPILDKIARSGIGSLTPNERRILDRARDRLLRESK
jgi:hypothetical protein